MAVDAFGTARGHVEWAGKPLGGRGVGKWAGSESSRIRPVKVRYLSLPIPLVIAGAHSSAGCHLAPAVDKIEPPPVQRDSSRLAAARTLRDPAAARRRVAGSMRGGSRAETTAAWQASSSPRGPAAAIPASPEVQTWPAASAPPSGEAKTRAKIETVAPLR